MPEITSLKELEAELKEKISFVLNNSDLDEDAVMGVIIIAVAKFRKSLEEYQGSPHWWCLDKFRRRILG